MKHYPLGFVFSAGTLAFVAGTAEAQTSAGALQLAIGTDAIAYSKESGTVHYPAPPTNVGDVSTDRSITRWGFSNRSAVNLEGGYGLGESLVLGGILGIGGWSFTRELGVVNPRDNQDVEQIDSTFDLLLAPKLDYMLMPGQSIRPFFGGALGLQYHSETTQLRTASDVTRTTGELSATGLAVLLRAGARFFLTPGFSIDPAFQFLWVPTASGSYQVATGNKYDLSAHSYQLGLSVAVSGWLGL